MNSDPILPNLRDFLRPDRRGGKLSIVLPRSVGWAGSPPSCPCSVTELLLATPGIVRRDLLELEWGCTVVDWRRREGGGGGVRVQSPSWRTLRSGAIYLIDPVAFAYVMLLTEGRVEDEINVGRGERRGKSTFG